MSSSARIEGPRRALGAVLALSAVLGGCSDIYYDRRETILLGANDAVDSNKVTQMVDPWPRYSENRNIPFNGERMQGAVERYRRHEVIKPVSPGTSSVTQQQLPTLTEAISVSNTQGNSNAPAAPVKGP